MFPIDRRENSPGGLWEANLRELFGQILSPTRLPGNLRNDCETDGSEVTPFKKCEILKKQVGSDGGEQPPSEPRNRKAFHKKRSMRN